MKRQEWGLFVTVDVLMYYSVVYLRVLDNYAAGEGRMRRALAME